MENFLKKLKLSSYVIATLSPQKKGEVLKDMAKALRKNLGKILEENEKDMQNAKEISLSSALLDRLLLNKQRVENMAKAIEDIASLNEPVGRIIDGWVVPSGLRIEKVSIPIGVIAIIVFMFGVIAIIYYNLNKLEKETS